MAIPSDDLEAIDIREKLAHIDEMLTHNEQMRQQTLADEALNPARLNEILAKHDRLRQEIRYAPWLAIVSGMTAGAALFAAGAAFMKLFGS